MNAAAHTLGAELISAELRVGTRQFLAALVRDEDALAWVTSVVEEAWTYCVGADRVARLAEAVKVMGSLPVMVRALSSLSGDDRAHMAPSLRVALAAALSQGGSALDCALNDALGHARLAQLPPAPGDLRPIRRPRM